MRTVEDRERSKKERKCACVCERVKREKRKLRFFFEHSKIVREREREKRGYEGDSARASGAVESVVSKGLFSTCLLLDLPRFPPLLDFI